MSDRFDADLRQVLGLAQEEARRLDHDFVHTEHVILGLIGAPGDAADVVRSFGVTLDEAEMPTADQLPDSLRTLAFRQGLRVRHGSCRADVARLVEAVAKD